MKEVEIKLRAGSAGEAMARLLEAGFAPQHERAFETNEVFDTEDGRLLQSRQLLRLREFRGQCLLTRKGPPEPGPHKTREENETQVASAAAMRRILDALGYRPVFRYEKYRTTWKRPGEVGEAVLDETPIGVFLELEGEAEWIDRTAAQMGFTPGDYILKSYGSLYREHCETAGIPTGNMVFPDGPQ